MAETQLPAAIIFDLDDTILDDSSAVESCWRAACEEAARRIGSNSVQTLRNAIDSVSVQTLRNAIDRQRDVYWSDPERHREGRLDLRAATRRIVALALEELGVGNSREAKTIAETYRDMREERTRLIPGAIDVLERTKELGIGTGMITNGDAAGQRKKIERFGLAQYFDSILIEGEFGYGKPDPRVYEATLQALASDPSRTWIVGDNLEFDIGAAQRLGIYGIWVDGGGNGLPAGTTIHPDRTIASIAELL